MSVREYVGARYVPVFADPIEWDSTKTYEPLTIVYYGGNSFTSRQYVPAGIDITNDTYWALTGNYNAQIEQYRTEVQTFDNRITGVENDILNVESDISDVEGNISTLETNTGVSASTASSKSLLDYINTLETNTGVSKTSTASESLKEYIDGASESLKEYIDGKTYTSVKDFGAVGDGVTDDTAAIQDAINSLKDVYFPTSNNETYKVTDTLTSGREGQSFFMDPSANTGVMFYCDDTTTVCFNVIHQLVRFADMHIRSHTANTGIGIKAEAPDYVDNLFTNNTDLTINNCDISNFHTGVQTNARGPYINGTTFAVLTNAIEIYWNAQSTSIGTAAQQVLYGNEYGMRGIQITDCRFHAITSNCIHITAGNPCGMIVNGNRFDVGQGFFFKAEDNCVVKSSSFTNNTMMYSNAQMMRFGGGIYDSTITGNTFLGFPPSNGMGNRTTTGIMLYVTTSHRLAITANSFMYCNEDAIRIGEADTTVISDNVFRHIGINASSSTVYGCVFVNDAANKLIVSNNTGSMENSYGHIVHSRSAVNWARSFVINNAIVGTVINNYTDGGQNTFQTALT